MNDDLTYRFTPVERHLIERAVANLLETLSFTSYELTAANAILDRVKQRDIAWQDPKS